MKTNQIEGIFVNATERVEGDNSRGHWVRGGFVIRVDGEYGSDYLHLTLFGEDKMAMIANFRPGESRISADYVVKSHEANGRWYTDARCLSVREVTPQQAYQGYPPQSYQPMQQRQPMAPTAPYPQYQQAFSQQPAAPNGGVTMPEQDLPF